VYITSPPIPTPTQTSVLGQLNPYMPVPLAWRFQVVPPSVVIRMGLSSPAAKQVPDVGQLIANRLLPLGWGFCQLHVPPALAAAGRA
jgi:hypothetical protein